MQLRPPVLIDDRAASVSILTRPGGRVQHVPEQRLTGHTRVSILTRPGGRVQPSSHRRVSGLSCCFNPHPSRRTGATIRHRSQSLIDSVSILTRPGGRVQRDGMKESWFRVQFQSSPVPEDGCNMECVLPSHWAERFQSSPVPEDGCNPSGWQALLH